MLYLFMDCLHGENEVHADAGQRSNDSKMIIDGATARLLAFQHAMLLYGHVRFVVLWASKYRWSNLNLRSSINFV
jgi:hypothetical protein